MNNDINNNMNNRIINNQGDNTIQQKQENIPMGVVGAIVGSFIGSIILIILYKIGYIASISGLIMVFLSRIGYEKLGGKLSKKGTIISLVVVLIVIFFSYNVAVAMEVVDVVNDLGYELSFFDAFTNIFNYLKDGELNSTSYYLNLVLIYIFGIAGASGILKNNKN